jgi:hypothetical protein
MSETKTPMPIADAVAAWGQRDIRFREFLQITGYSRGYIQGIEQRGLWKYGGTEKGTGNWRAYSLKDMVAFMLGEVLMGAGFTGESAWALIRDNLDQIIEGCLLRKETDFSEMRNTIQITIPTA